MDPNGNNPRRLTDNLFGDGFPALSPDGRKIVFDSNRLPPELPLNLLDMFIMDADGTNQTFLIRGGGGSSSPDGDKIAFHRSASGTGLPVTTRAGAATVDSDIIVLGLQPFQVGAQGATNITNRVGMIDDDPDWSSRNKIVFTSHSADDPNQFQPSSAEIFVVSPNGTGLKQLTDNGSEERAPEWSPDGAKIAFSCLPGGPGTSFEICIMDADGHELQVLPNTRGGLAPSWSRDGRKIFFNERVPAQIFVVNVDGSGVRTQLTTAGNTNPGALNQSAMVGVVRITQDDD
jgi:TolB protein